MNMSTDLFCKNVTVHNLKNVTVTIPKNCLTVLTGVSGSGKSSLAFDTIYVEGQRRYIESLSTHAQRHMGSMPKPQAELIDGITPTIAIEQKSAGKNPRSTVGTMTSIYDFLRVLYARLGVCYCPISNDRVSPQSQSQILDKIFAQKEGGRWIFLAPYIKEKKGELKEDLANLQKRGFMRIRIDETFYHLEDEIVLDKNSSHDIDLVIDRLTLSAENANRVTEAVLLSLELGKGMMMCVNDETQEELFFSEHAYSPKADKYYPPLDPSDFSFNHPEGMCPQCKGLGTTQEFDLDQIIDPEKSIIEGCCSIAPSYETVKWGNIYENLAEQYKFSLEAPWKTLASSAQKVFLFGNNKKWTRMRFTHPVKRTSWTDYIHWTGVVGEAKRRLSEAKSDLYRRKMQELMTISTCSQCQGDRIKDYPSKTQFFSKTIGELCNLSIAGALDFFRTITLKDDQAIIGKDLILEVIARLEFLNQVGLGYLTLSRTSPTLSGGESQRVRLAQQIGCGLVGTTYVLDEPSIGLHPRDNVKLIETLKLLRDKGNTILVVEHDEETILAADHLIDIGPGAGVMGGEILCEGHPLDVLKVDRSLTVDYLLGRAEIPIPKKRRKKSDKWLTVHKAALFNLKNVTCQIPLERFVAITGISGSGKSSLITQTLFPYVSNALSKTSLAVGPHEKIEGVDQLDKVIAIDQSPIGRTPRSNPATYIKVFDEIRDLFASLPESKANGYKKGRFSFNVAQGSCPNCRGMGMCRIDMDFLEDEWVTCPICQGKRFDEKTLSIHYKERNIYDVLEMSVEDAARFFENIPSIFKKLTLLEEVGLGYIRIGQSSTTLSGGEAQRVKLAKELIRPETGSTLYILDEPTTGLHFEDIRKLVAILQRLVDHKNSVVVIEHNMDLVKTADYVIDMGPDGGDGGGEIVAVGTPEQVAKKKTATAPFIHEALYTDRSRRAALQKGAEKSSHTKMEVIDVVGARENNLRDVSLQIPREKMSVFTGPSGSGKTSLAFDTIYNEGQRRYIDSLSGFAKQFVKQMPKPKCDDLQGLSPAISIEQKRHAGNPRSTVGTMTEIYDFLRVLLGRVGVAYCPESGFQIKKISSQTVCKYVLSLGEKARIEVLAPIPLDRKNTFEEVKKKLIQKGFLRVRLNGTLYELDEEIPIDTNVKQQLELVVDRVIVKKGGEKRILDAIESASLEGNDQLVIRSEKEEKYFNLAFGVEETGKSYPPISPHTFSFNQDEGMCMECQGLGVQYGASLEKSPLIARMTPNKCLLKLTKEYTTPLATRIFSLLCDAMGIDPDQTFSKMSDAHKHLFFNGSEKKIKVKECKMEVRWKGLNQVIFELGRHAHNEIRFFLLPYLEKKTCHACNGSRLNPLARNVQLAGKTITEICEMDISDALKFAKELPKKLTLTESLKDLIQTLISRLDFIVSIGLGYLSLSRSAPTLSGGETQRLRLARQLGSGLTGCLYVLDEPTIGLHPYDNDLLNHSLKKLLSLGNTLLLVEHDPLTIQMADQIFDFGPGAGVKGGEVIAQGSPKELMKNPHSLTGKYLANPELIPTPTGRKKAKMHLTFKGAKQNNLKNLTFSIPLSTITCITGVSGSGKSTLVDDVIVPTVEKALGRKGGGDTIEHDGIKVSGLDAINKLLYIDQKPIGTTNRADVSTFMDLYTQLRNFFATLPLAKAKGLLPRYFSFNHKKGMCTKCRGLGYLNVELQFMPPVRTACDACKGLRLNPLSLDVRYKGKNIGQLLKITVDDVLNYLPPIPKVIKIVEGLIDVGLGYLTLGQEIATLSGGEAGRLRLCREMIKPSSGKTLYIFDEPTTGLHSVDIQRLLHIFKRLVEKKNSLVIVEHNLDIIKNADTIIDLGPGSGPHGGQIIATGTPEEVAKIDDSYTARYLKETLAHKDKLSLAKI
ncbi:MAG: UvrABC system protein A [Chlamydiia bacterium]|nr:UvrABC system protein A [Chlamydiia bacterium]